MDPAERFAAAVGRPDPEVPLDEAALCIAAHAAPGLDVDAQLARLDDLAARCREPTLDGLRRLLFSDLGFVGNTLDYHDPRNSLLHEVLDRRTGIPITLAVVLMEVGRRLGVPLAGVSMPGHFLVRDRVDPEVFVDAFDHGRVIDRAGCRRRFHALHPGVPFDERFLDPSPRRAVVVRMLANLQGIYVRAADRDALRWVLALRSSVPGEGRRMAARLN